uniref:Uncharacterized protein n=1 Tax=Hippocampus comes TaxID=109280 RepID=A0A3Q3DQT3_HIPCM
MGEPADSWIRRMYEEGADSIGIDAGDHLRLGGLSSDSQMNSEFRTLGRQLRDGDELTLFALYAMSAQAVYPTWHDWPEIKGQWLTMRDAIQRMGRLCTRESISRTGHAFVDDEVVPKVVRDALIRDAPPHYRSAILTILLGAVEHSFSDVKTRLLELATLGDWGETARQPHSEDGWICSKEPPTNILNWVLFYLATSHMRLTFPASWWTEFIFHSLSTCLGSSSSCGEEEVNRH